MKNFSKKRLYFVSNSSSSSFTCEICNHVESGWDLSYEDSGFVCCENDHTFCEEHLLEGYSEHEESKEDDEESYSIGEIPEKFCPICNFSEPSYPELMQYFLKTTEISEKEVFEEIKKVNKRRKVLRDHEYVEYVLRLKELTVDGTLEKLKSEYVSYKNFKEFLRSK